MVFQDSTCLSASTSSRRELCGLTSDIQESVEIDIHYRGDVLDILVPEWDCCAQSVTRLDWVISIG